MAQKSDDGHLGAGTNVSRHLSTDTNEFENAVTSEIGDISTGKHDDISILDIDVSTHVAPAEYDTLEPGDTLSGRFEIVALVHSGGMGHIYKAVDNRRHRGGSGQIHVAIKMIRRTVAPQRDVRLALEREAARARTLSHPNIISIFDFDEHDGQFFLVMEWLEGESVNALLKRTRGKTLAPEFAWSIVEGTAAAVQHAHLHNVVHADINPSNIFVTKTDEIKLLDFGVARYLDDTGSSASKRFAWVTKTYASPDVLSGSLPVFADDIFSLGCVAYRLLSGEHPFGGSASLVAKHLGMEVRPVSGLAASDWGILSRALSYARSDRPATVGAFLRHDSSTVGLGDEGPWSGRQRMLWPVIAAAAASAIIAGGWWFSQGETQNEPPSDAATTQPDELATVDTIAASARSAVDTLLSSAAQAMEMQRFIRPEDSSARVLYREVLSIEAANPSALRGLRTISDEFVRQANEALRAGDPVRASAALATAAETDPENPAIMVSHELIVVQGNRQLADARLAVVEGDGARAAELLSRAEQYDHLDEEAINEVRLQIAQDTQEGLFLERLATADAHMTGGRLTAPAEENAHAILVGLYEKHGDDSRLLSSMERLGERMLTRAAYATAAAEFSNAGKLLDAVETLGVLSPEVTEARASLQGAIDAAMPDEATNTGIDVTASEPAAAAAAEPEVPALLADSETAVVLQSANDEPSQPKLRKLEELGIRSYVAPIYPRGASRRRINGFVEIGFHVNTDGRTSAIDIVNAEPAGVFDASAENAVRQWRFAPQDDVVRARVTVRFESPQ